MRSGDRPAGNAAATDQPSAETKITGESEDNGTAASAGNVHPTDEAEEAGQAADICDKPDEPTSGDLPMASESADGALEYADRAREDGDTAREDLAEAREDAAEARQGADGAAREDAAEALQGADGAAREDDGPAGPGPETRPAAPGPRASWLGGARIGAWAGLLGQRQLGGTGLRPDRQARYPDAGGTGFARLTVLPAILIMAWLLVGLPLLLAGVFLPTPVLLGSVVLAVLLLAGLRRVPAGWPPALPGAARAGRAAPAVGVRPRRERGWPACWGLAGTVAVAAGFAFWQFVFNSESVIVLRDPGAYLQTGYWIAQHGSLPIPQSLAAFGGAHAGLTFSSTGFAASGASVVPGLMSGLPLLLAGAFWVHGTAAAAAMGPLLGGLAVLAFGGLVGRLTGPQWAPAGALVLACTLPEQYTSRASFSETAAQVLLFGGLSLVIDALTIARARTEAAASTPAEGAEATAPPSQTLALSRETATSTSVPSDPTLDPVGSDPTLDPVRSDPVPSDPTLDLVRSDPTSAQVPPGPLPAPVHGWRRGLGALSPGSDRAPEWALMALGGLALGLTSLVRFDGLLDVLPAIPFVGVLVVRGNRIAVPFCIGVAIGAAYGIADGYLLARPFIDSLQPMPELIGLIAAWLLAMTVAGVELMRLPGFRGGLRPVLARRPVRWLPDLCAVLAVAAIIGLAIRPYLQTVRGPATGPVANFVASLQRLEHLPVAPGRLYAEDTLYWVIWYVGLPAVLLGGFGLALLVRRCLRALFSWRDQPSAFAARLWALPLAVICCGSAAVLWQPETVPDQPWASRRLVPLVIPGLILCAIWAAAWLRGRAQSRGASKTAASVVAAFCIAALLVPTVATSFGFTTNHSGKGGALGVTADGLALKRTGPGEVGAVSRLCSLLGPSASVVIVALPVAQQFSQVIRGMCGIPTGSMVGQPAGTVQSVLGSIEHAGRRPVLLGARPSQLYAYGGGSPVRVLDLSTSQDPHTLTQPPSTLFPAHYVIWMSSVGPVGSRV